MMRPDTAAGSDLKYKGVRKRKWGKWVTEVRLPNSRERIWLGSYNSPEKAARAFDAAVFCLRGSRARLNFPDNPPQVPVARSLTREQIQAVAARHAHSVPVSEEVTMTSEEEAAVARTMTPETNSPVVSTSEMSEEVAAAPSPAETDWSLLDLMTSPVIDELYYDFGAPVAPAPAPADGAAEDGGNGLGTTSFLWNFGEF